MWCPRLLLRRATSNKKLFGNDFFCASPWQNNKSMAANTSLFFDQNREEFVFSKSTRSPYKSTTWTFLRVNNSKWVFHNLDHLLRPLESMPVSWERVVPTERQVRTLLGDTVSKSKVMTVQAPQYRQHALISDFLDTNWIDHRPEGLKLQHLALATLTGTAMSCLRKHLTADVQHAIIKCDSLGQGNNDPSRGSIGDCSNNFAACGSFQCCMLLQSTLGGGFDIFASSGESTAWVLLCKTRSRPIGVRVCLVAHFNFFQHRNWPAWVDNGCVLEGRFGTAVPSYYTWERRRRWDQLSITAKRNFLLLVWFSFSSKASWSFWSTSWTLSWTTRSAR